MNKDQSGGFSGKVALVTGAASGIGRSTAKLFIECGASVLGIDLKFKNRVKEGQRRSERKSAIAGDLFQSSRFVKFGADVSSENEVREAVKKCEQEFGRLDVVVNCAGIEMSGTVLELSEGDFDKVMKTNVKSVFLVSKHSIPLILRTIDRARKAGEDHCWGSIVNISSDLGIQPIPRVDVYAASKGAIISLTKAMSKNWARRGIRVNCVAPGPIDTPLLHRFQSKQMLNFVKDRLIPLGRLGSPEEVARVVVFLALGKYSSFVNGAVVTVNGGLVG